MNHSNDINNICAIIPFYNEEKHIKNIIHKVSKYVDIIIAVNDGSTDNSLNQIEKKDNLILITHKKNMGKGYALRTGFEKSIELNTNISITLDADLQHAPEYIPNFIEKINEYDAVIGNRMNNKKGMPIHRKFSNFLTSKILEIKTGYKIFDSQSGFRAFKTKILKDILPSFAGFEAESEMIVKLLKAQYTLGFVDIPTIYGDDESKMKAWKTIKGFIKVIARKY